MRKLEKHDPADRGFRHPPVWIHVAEAGKWLLAPREAKKRAVIRILDRLGSRGPTPPTKV